MTLIQEQIIDVIQFDKDSITVHYKLKHGVSGNYKIKMIDEKTNGYFYHDNLHLDPNITYWTSCSFIKNHIYNKIKIIFEYNNNIVFENSYVVYENFNKNCLSDLYFNDDDICINSYFEVFAYETYSKYNIFIEKDDIVVDIGANVGASIKLALDNKCKEIYCCEPNPSCVNIIKKYYGQNKNLYINEYAIADYSGFSELILPSIDNTSAAATVLQHNSSKNNKSDYVSIRVRTKTFKDFILDNNISKIDFLKVDCEGGEKFIFSNENIDFIKTNVRKIALEYHTHDLYNQIENLLKKFGFEIYVWKLSDQMGMMYARNNNLLT